MLDLSGNISLSFGAQYKAEDTASYILYQFDRSCLKCGYVSGERFARFLGLKVFCEEIFCGGKEQGLGVLAYEPQLIYTSSGRLEINCPSIAAEADIIYRGEYKLYNLSLMLLCVHYLYSLLGEREECRQLFFGLEQTQSTKNISENLKSVYASLLSGEDDKVINLALCLLMPKNRFKVDVNALFSSLGVNRSTLSVEKHLSYVSRKLSDIYAVPREFVCVRLRRLNYI